MPPRRRLRPSRRLFAIIPSITSVNSRWWMSTGLTSLWVLLDLNKRETRKIIDLAICGTVTDSEMPSRPSVGYNGWLCFSMFCWEVLHISAILYNPVFFSVNDLFSLNRVTVPGPKHSARDLVSKSDLPFRSSFVGRFTKRTPRDKCTVTVFLEKD